LLCSGLSSSHALCSTCPKELGVPTVFNILGPLSNPAKPKAAAIGVANDRMHLVMAQVLADKGVDGFVFRGDDGLDEITLATTTSVLTLGNGQISSDLLDPLDFSIPRAPISALAGGDALKMHGLQLRFLLVKKAHLEMP